MECRLLHFSSRELSNRIKFYSLCRFQLNYSANGSWVFTALTEPSCNNKGLEDFVGFSFNKVAPLLWQCQMILTKRRFIKIIKINIKINIRDDTVTWNICYRNLNHYSLMFKSRVTSGQLRVAEVVKFFAFNGARIIPVIRVYSPRPDLIEMLTAV